MKALLMHRDRDFNPAQELPSHEKVLTQDLELNTLFRAMSGKDKILYNVVRTAIILSPRNDLETILYRQEIMKDCLRNPLIVRKLHDLSIEAMERKKKHWYGFFSRPSMILYTSIELLQMFMMMLGKLRIIADENASRFQSEGFTTLFATLKRELSDEYFSTVHHHLSELKFRKGVLLSSELGDINESINHVLRKPHYDRWGWIKRILGNGPPEYTFRLHDRDEAGARILSELRDRGINLVANAVTQSADHILSYFDMLRTELAFYVGCLNLHEKLKQMGVPITFPVPKDAGTRRHSFRGLIDVCLALTMGRSTVGNTADADGKNLIFVTGANQGGKSTFLRSIGLAQLMMQCGMFVGAESFTAEICKALFTHYKREEDTTMKSGKLDEELARLSDIVDHIMPNSLLLCNESFAATNEREGSEIARQVVLALLEKKNKIFFVTHLYDFAHGFFDRRNGNTLFLRAERKADGTRTFKLMEGEPMDTSYGDDLYREVFLS